MAAVQDPIEPTKAGRYPVILSDALLGKGNTEAFTSVKYNFKPNPAPNSTQGDTIIQPADPSANSYNLTFTEENEEYAYQGARQPGEGQYVLVFSPERKAFILHQVDSTFNMNVVSTPWDQDADSLRTTYAHLGATTAEPDTKRRKAEPKPKAQPRAQSKAQSKAAPKTQAKTQAKSQPKKKAVQREPTPEEESDDGLTIEYPDGPPRKSNHSAAVPIARTETIENDSEEEESDVDTDERNKDVDVIRLPSPAGHTGNEEEEEDGFNLDLEAELEQALEKEVDRADESSESEEE